MSESFPYEKPSGLPIITWFFMGNVTAACFLGSRVVKVKVGSTGKLGVGLKGFGIGTFALWERVFITWGRMFACIKVEAMEFCCLGLRCYDLATCLPLERWL